MKLVLPREHGTWAMFLLPVLLGTFLSSPSFVHVLFIVGWFFLFLSATPMYNAIRMERKRKEMMKWFITYLAFGLIFLIPVILIQPRIVYFSLCLPPLIGVNVYFILEKNERSLWNDFSGIVLFSLGGAATYFLGTKSFTSEMVNLSLYLILYFMGSAFYVKSLIREWKNKKFKWFSHVFHGLLLIPPIFITSMTMSLAYVPNVLKDWFTTRKRRLKPIHIGITEIVNACVFFVLCLLLF
ncbi:YwiC-like family protein [Pontibacillus litoralis]|uniref:YwiC-like protein n=1 Tax=Pontibacillus litoralis JSM 072002 TaxID=1385512 RepID=A0A0A5GAA3_9BACI|nr:YwiC-like family protein [Pontibacillus litoralis]KGX88015.1 hypothetical protein N784_12325 [Pontibacillus litoralis JSM 072002]